MRMPSYTTRVMLSFLLLAIFAGILGVGSTYRIRGSLQKMQAQFHENNHQVDLALKLHEAVERRGKAETYFLGLKNDKFLGEWNDADDEFSKAFAALNRSNNTGTARAALAEIGRANEEVRNGWFSLISKNPANVGDRHALQDIEKLEALIDSYTSSRSRATNEAEETALAETNVTLFGSLLFSGFVLGLAAIMAIYVSDTLRRPLADLLTATQKIAKGQLDHRIDIGRADEIGALTAAFDEMSSELHRKDVQITGQLEQLEQTKSLLETNSHDLESKNKEMESFIYSVSHDLKAPLIAIQGFLAMFADEFSATLSAKASFYVQRVQANSQHMQTLIQQLLELSRAGQSGGHLTAISTKQLVKQVLDDLNLQIEAKGAQIELVGEWPSVVAEPTRLKQAITNLVDNALHYGQADGEISIGITVEDHGRVWRFCVRDNGIGIDPIYQSKIFEMFERLSDSHEKNENGTGIGLAIVKKIAEAHGGEVGVESILGRGSTFYFEISKNLRPSGKTVAEVRV